MKKEYPEDMTEIFVSDYRIGRHLLYYHDKQIQAMLFAYLHNSKENEKKELN